MTISEWCSHCCSEVELKEEFIAQSCPSCNELILPCAQCETEECGNCPITTNLLEENRND
jgi:hypothetical protein